MSTVRRSNFIAHFLEPLPQGVTEDQMKQAYLQSRASDVAGTFAMALAEVAGGKFRVTQHHKMTRKDRGHIEESFTVERDDGEPVS